MTALEDFLQKSGEGSKLELPKAGFGSRGEVGLGGRAGCWCHRALASGHVIFQPLDFFWRYVSFYGSGVAAKLIWLHRGSNFINSRVQKRGCSLFCRFWGRTYHRHHPKKTRVCKFVTWKRKIEDGSCFRQLTNSVGEGDWDRSSLWWNTPLGKHIGAMALWPVSAMFVVLEEIQHQPGLVGSRSWFVPEIPLWKGLTWTDFDHEVCILVDPILILGKCIFGNSCGILPTGMDGILLKKMVLSCFVVSVFIYVCACPSSLCWFLVHQSYNETAEVQSCRCLSRRLFCLGSRQRVGENREMCISVYYVYIYIIIYILIFIWCILQT